MKHFSYKLMALLLMLSMPWLANATAPFTEGFESSSLPETWTTIHVSGSPTWQTVRNNYYVAPHSGDYSAMVSYAYSGGADNYLVTPLLTPVAGEVLQFYLASQSYTGTTVTIEVSEASNTDAADFTTVLATYQSNVDITNKWGEAKELSLSAYAGKQIYVAFHVIDNNGGNIYVDDVSIIAPVSCAKPLDLVATATPDGAQLAWKGEEGSQYQYCIMAAGETPAGWQLLNQDVFAYTATGLIAGNAYDAYVRTYCSETEQSVEIKQTFTPACHAPAQTELSELTHNTATLSWSEVAGVSRYQFVCLRADSTPDWAIVQATETLTVTIDTLQPSTTYNFYVRAYFNAETQSEAAKTTFTTNCVAATLPYSETFDKATTLPVCWEAGNVTNATWKMYTYGDEGYSGNCLQFSGRNGATATLKTPAIELSDKALLKFYWKNASAISVKLQISTNGGSSKTDIDTDLSATQSTLVEKTIDLSAYEGETVTFYFVASNTLSSNRTIYMDELSVVLKPCELPKQLKAEASSTGAVVTWAAGSDEAQWNLRYRATGTDDWTTMEALTETAYTLTGLISGTEYEVQVQASCAVEKQSDWTASATFTPQCPVPGKPAASMITFDEATITWDGTEEKYNLQYREKGTEEWIPVANIEAKEYVLVALAASTTYEVQVQSACGGEWTASRTFTTACGPLSDAIPYTENFDDLTTLLPDCWARRTEGDYPMVEATKGAYGVGEDSVANCLVFKGEGEQMVILPAFDTQLNGLTLEFFYKLSASSVNMEVCYLTSLYGAPQQLVILDNTVYTYGSAPYQLELKELPAEALYLAIRYTSASQWNSAHVDNISLSVSAATALGNTHVQSQTTKRIENGALILEYNGTKFDATGRKL